MATRAATVWVITCDAPDCDALVAPPIERTTIRPTEREGRYLLLSGRMEAFAAARRAEWPMTKSPHRGCEYCPEHAHLAHPLGGE